MKRYLIFLSLVMSVLSLKASEPDLAELLRAFPPPGSEVSDGIYGYSGHKDVDELRARMREHRYAMRRRMMPPKPYISTVKGATWSYRVKDDVVSIEGATAPTVRELVVPESFEGKAVTALNSYLFVPIDPPIVTITLPKHLTEIAEKGANPFRNMYHLESIEISPDNEKYAAYDGALYTKDLTELIAVPIAKKSVTLPKGLLKIRNGAFANSKIAGSLELPSSVRYIGEAAFMGANELTELSVPSAAVLSDSALNDCKLLKLKWLSLSTPKGFIDDYDEALRLAKAEGKRVYAVFTGSDWCHYCKELESRLLSKAEFVEELSNGFELLYIDMPRDKSRVSPKAKEENRTLARKYKVVGLPSIMILDENGDFVKRVDRGRPGETPRETAKRMLTL